VVFLHHVLRPVHGPPVRSAHPRSSRGSPLSLSNRPQKHTPPALPTQGMALRTPVTGVVPERFDPLFEGSAHDRSSAAVPTQTVKDTTDKRLGPG
jgi:hypothetical protein